MTGETLLGIDGGGSGTTWATFGPDGLLLSQGTVEALTGHLFTDQDRAATRALLERLAGQLKAGQDGLRLAGVVAGISGLQQGAHVWFQQVLAEIFGLSADLIRVTDDVTLAYAAQFAPGQGALVYAGTGSVAYLQDAHGEVLRAGGHGFLLGDEGGAFWQGQQGLKSVLSTQDQGRDPAGPLADELRAAVGSLDWPHLRQWVYGGGRAALATLAPAVHRAALAGDADALSVNRRAGEALAQLAGTLLGRSATGPTGAGSSNIGLPNIGLPVTLAGGAANCLVRDSFSSSLARLRPDVTQIEPRPPVLGAPKLSPLPRFQATPSSALAVQPSEEDHRA